MDPILSRRYNKNNSCGSSARDHDEAHVLDVLESLYLAMRMKLLIAALLFIGLVSDSFSQEAEKPGKAIYLELGGKGFFSANLDLPLGQNGRMTIGLTALDNEFKKDADEEEYPNMVLPTPGIMLFRLWGKERHYFELGGGVSISPVFWKEYSPNDSPISIHGALGYRMQSADRFFFRAGLTPFYRVNWAFLPLVGVSFGYSW